MKRLVVVSILALSALVSLALSDTKPPKDSGFIFARVEFNMSSRWLYYFPNEEPWHHDHPFSEHFVMGTMKSLTTANVTTDSYQIVKLDSPDLFKYPFLYFSEPGFMELTPRELTNLREWFNRGGFAVFDDFRTRKRYSEDMANLRNEMYKVFPDREFFKLTIDHPIFHTFYDIDTLEMRAPYYEDEMTPEFMGLNDDRGRLIAIANHNNDMGEFFEWVDKGEMPLQPAAKSARLMLNYLIYGLTH